MAEFPPFSETDEEPEKSGETTDGVGFFYLVWTFLISSSDGLLMRELVKM